jgi:glucosyl-3-phosphoglycerate synthase
MVMSTFSPTKALASTRAQLGTLTPTLLVCPAPAMMGAMVKSSAGILTFGHAEFSSYSVKDMKGDRSISVIIPARDEERTVGGVVSVVRDVLIERLGIVDELLVVDDGSTDATALVATSAGARVIEAVPRSAELGAPIGLGKGGAMRRGLEASTGEFVVFLDADVTNTKPHFVTGLLGPLLADDGVALVKGFYRRPFHGGRTGGGRVTELTARPVISLCFPELVGVHQPLAGETASRASVLRGLSFEPGYGVELGMLIDVVAQYGIQGISQVDLGVRTHRNRPLAELGPQATEVLSAALQRVRVIAHEPF